MATLQMSSSTASPTSWRDKIKITRTGVFSVLFILAGLWILLSVVPSTDPTTISTLTFGPDASGQQIAVDVVIVSYMTGIAILYIVAGVFGLLPFPALSRFKFWLLLLCGISIFPTVLTAAAAGQSTNIVSMLGSSLRLSTPIILGALAGIWCERAGVVNIAIEGMMLTGAAFGFLGVIAVNPLIQNNQMSLVVGVIVALLAGGLMSALHAWLSIRFKTDQIISGTVINFLALGLTSFLRREVLLTSTEGGRETFQNIRIDFLADNIPIVGETLFNAKPIFYSMFILLIVTHVVLFYTRWGLRTRAVGENPHAADTLGINVIRTRWINVIIGGMIAGLAGAWLSLETTGTFDDNMTAGRGFIALAAMIFGKWLPFGAFGGGLLFGFSSALETRFQILGVELPPQFLQMTPYVVTLIVLAGLVGRAESPKADGVPYEKE